MFPIPFNKENIIVTLTFNFALQIIKYCEGLQESKKFVISNQLLKSGTSIGANIREAQNPESNADFVHKFKIAAKEIKETEYWLDIIEECYTKYDINKISELLDEVAKITNSIISTMKNKTKINHLHIRLTYYPLVLGRGRH